METRSITPCRFLRSYIRDRIARILPASAALAAILFILPGSPVSAQIPVPDFYQHQAWLPATNGNANVPQPGALGAGWETTGGFCGPVAIMDALYPWYVIGQGASLGFVNIFNRSGAAIQITNPGGGGPVTITDGNWVPGYEAVVNQIRTKVFAPGQGINTFLNAVGSGPQQGGFLKLFSLTDTTYNINNATGKVTTILSNGMTINIPGSPYAVYNALETHANTTDLLMRENGRPNTLWWGNYHALAGVGTTGNANQIWVADPDSVPINGGPLGGWSVPPPVNAAAVATVKKNLYTNAQAAGGVPFTGNAGYTNAQLYGTLTLDAKGNITAASNTNYSVPAVTVPATNPPVTYLSNIDAITPTWLRYLQGVKPRIRAQGASIVNDTFEVDGEQTGSIDKVEIFPVGGLADTNFTFNDPGWTESAVTTDPFGDAMPGGGELLQVGTGADLVNGDAFNATLDTNSTITGWDAFIQYSDGFWQVQSFGAPGDSFPDQTAAVPEPGIAAFGAGGLLFFGFVLKRKRR